MCLSLLFVSIVSIWITLNPPGILESWLEFDPIPYFDDRLFYFMVGILSGVLSYLYETFFIEHIILGVRERYALLFLFFIQSFRHLKRKQLTSGTGTDINRFERLLLRIGGEPSWLRAKLSQYASSLDVKTNGTNSRETMDNGKVNPVLHQDEDVRLLNVDTPMTDRSSAPLIQSDHSDEIEMSDAHLRN